MSPSDFSPLAGVSWWFWPHTCERELSLRLHFKMHERLLWEAGGGGSPWHFVVSVSPINCLSLACLVRWVIARQLWHFGRWRCLAKGKCHIRRFLTGCSSSPRRMTGEAGGRAAGRDAGLGDSGQGEETEMLSLPPKEPSPWVKTKDKGNKAPKGHREDVSCFKEGKRSLMRQWGNYKFHALESW